MPAPLVVLAVVFPASEFRLLGVQSRSRWPTELSVFRLVAKLKLLPRKPSEDPRIGRYLNPQDMEVQRLEAPPHETQTQVHLIIELPVKVDKVTVGFMLGDHPVYP